MAKAYNLSNGLQIKFIFFLPPKGTGLSLKKILISTSRSATIRMAWLARSMRTYHAHVRASAGRSANTPSTKTAKVAVIDHVAISSKTESISSSSWGIIVVVVVIHITKGTSSSVVVSAATKAVVATATTAAHRIVIVGVRRKVTTTTKRVRWTIAL